MPLGTKGMELAVMPERLYVLLRSLLLQELTQF